ncbi:(3S,6E)-nerolidol synthase 1-like [Canna indica]|uniref:(3S,6E)-nerolidol synthase 1-like n=1 Tax=Canna indica TaxID=4628 RepID=A0AAQ3L0V3_9LILI|nr:(3S,6E)-nerolidol synthase 1-like [Canna indica]
MFAINSSSSFGFLQYKCNATELEINSKLQFPKKKQQLLMPTKDHNLGDLCYKHEENLAKVRSIFYEAKNKNRLDLMLAIDYVQKLDVDYHFVEEIEESMESLYSNRFAITDGQLVNNFFQDSLLFRLLRQARYPVSSNIFERFLDDKGEFMTCLTQESDGMISLLEASYLNTGENILHKANTFATDYFNSSMAHFEPHFAQFIQQTLDHPYHMSLRSFKARQFLHRHCQFKHHHKEMIGIKYDLMDEFARSDFSLIQSLHHMELKEVTCWWKNLGLAEELKFARDQPLKWYTWSMTALSNPKYSSYRVALTKVIAFIYLFDDIFDVYGSLDELHLFTEAISKWDLSSIDSLPSYMRICYVALYNTINEIAEMVFKEHGWNPIDSLKKSWMELCNAFLVEAKWFAENQVPLADEYMRNGTISCGVPMVLTHIFFLLGQGLTHQNVKVIESCPNLITCPAKILRLWDDLGSAEDEEQDGTDGSIMECLMKEKLHCSGESSAREEVTRMIAAAWEELNKESFSWNSSCSPDFVKACVNTARMVRVMYSYSDEHQLPVLDQYINMLLFEKI